MRTLGRALLCLFLTLPGLAAAGPYADDMAKCLVRSTSAGDKSALVKWMFGAMALHPDVAAMASVSPQQRKALDQDFVRLFDHLLTKACVKETREALKYEGSSTIESSFSVLGQVAARELFAHPAVVAGMAEMNKLMDIEKLKKALDVAP